VIEPRLASHMQIEALKRQTEQQGGFAVIVHKGDPVSGAILILCLEKGRYPKLFEKMPSLDGKPNWQVIWSEELRDQGKAGELSAYIERRKARDSDLWMIELDVADQTLFNGIVSATG